MLEVEVLAEGWRIECNSFGSYGFLDFRTPEAFRAERFPKTRGSTAALIS